MRSPRVSGRTTVAAAVKNQARSVIRSVESLVAHSEGLDVEILLVDTGSGSKAIETFSDLQRRYPAVTLLRVDGDPAVSAALNAGLAAATGDVVVFLVGETMVTSGWLPPLRAQLDAGVAAVQPLVLARAGAVRNAGYLFAPEGLPYPAFREFAGDAPEVAAPARRAALSDACLALRTETALTLGGFDTAYTAALHDVDLCLRIRRSGLGDCVIEPAGVVLEPDRKVPVIPQPDLRTFRDRWPQLPTDDDGVWNAAGYEVLGYPDPATGAEPGVAIAPPLVARTRERTGLRWSLKVATPDYKARETWGDFHFAAALQGALRRQGQEVVLDYRNCWYRETAPLDDVVLVLRGLERYAPNPDHVNLLWLISHPDAFTEEEAAEFDHVFAAGDPYARRLAERVTTPVETLLQATDPDRFSFGAPDPDLHHDVLFIGNSRNEYRPVVKAAVEAGLPLAVYGGLWEQFLPEGVLRGTHVPNASVPAYYRSARVVLNDHWSDMRREGFLSNRLFDLVACGATVVSDTIAGLEEVFGSAIATYDSVDEVGPVVRRILDHPPHDIAARRAFAERIRTQHSFDARAQRLVEVARDLHAARLARPGADVT